LRAIIANGKITMMSTTVVALGENSLGVGARLFIICPATARYNRQHYQPDHARRSTLVEPAGMLPNGKNSSRKAAVIGLELGQTGLVANSRSGVQPGLEKTNSRSPWLIRPVVF
jgi:hypothetical protein